MNKNYNFITLEDYFESLLYLQVQFLLENMKHLFIINNVNLFLKQRFAIAIVNISIQIASEEIFWAYSKGYKKIKRERVRNLCWMFSQVTELLNEKNNKYYYFSLFSLFPQQNVKYFLLDVLDGKDLSYIYLKAFSYFPALKILTQFLDFVIIQNFSFSYTSKEVVIINKHSLSLFCNLLEKINQCYMNK